jgi:hypothetical protein
LFELQKPVIFQQTRHILNQHAPGLERIHKPLDLEDEFISWVIGYFSIVSTNRREPLTGRTTSE